MGCQRHVDDRRDRDDDQQPAVNLLNSRNALRRSANESRSNPIQTRTTGNFFAICMRQ